MSLEHQEVDLSTLNKGDVVRAVAETDRGAYIYDFLIEAQGKYPTAVLTQTNPDGTVVSPEATCMLEGSGYYLTREQNPVQQREGQVTISYGMLGTGGTIIILDPNERAVGRRYELLPKCTRIEVLPNTPSDPQSI